MPFFETRVRNLKLTFSPFSSEAMMSIGQVVLDHIRERIQSAKDVTDSPSKPLRPSYAEEKAKGRYVALGGPTKYRGKPVRDWTLRGRTMQACKVKTASQNSVVIGPTSDETSKIMMWRNRVDNMWGISPSDHEAMLAVVRASLRGAVVRVERTALEKVA